MDVSPLDTTAPPTNPPTHQPTNPPTHRRTNSPTHQLTNPPLQVHCVVEMLILRVCGVARRTVTWLRVCGVQLHSSPLAHRRAPYPLARRSTLLQPDPMPPHPIPSHATQPVHPPDRQLVTHGHIGGYGPPSGHGMSGCTFASRPPTSWMTKAGWRSTISVSLTNQLTFVFSCFLNRIMRNSTLVPTLNLALTATPTPTSNPDPNPGPSAYEPFARRHGRGLQGAVPPSLRAAGGEQPGAGRVPRLLHERTAQGAGEGGVREGLLHHGGRVLTSPVTQ